MSRGPAFELAADLRRAVQGEVRFSAGDRALYSADALIYRTLPIGVVQPLDTEDVLAALAVCREHDVPVLARGAGTSQAGQSCNAAVVLDFSRHLTRVLEVDPERRLARVEPGVALDRLRGEAERHQLTFGPDPSTHQYCTLGDIIVMLDADGSADPGEIPKFVKALQGGTDFAKGTRFSDGGGSADTTWHRRLGHTGLLTLANWLCGTHYTDRCYGMNAFRAHCLPYRAVDRDGFEVETQIFLRLAKAKLSVQEVGSFEARRIFGSSNLRTVRDGFRVLGTILSERRRKGNGIAPMRREALPSEWEGV